MKKFYVVGTKTSKSLSPLIFNYWFKKHKIKSKYGYIELNLGNFNKKIKSTVFDKSVGGLNITIPFKQKIIKHIDVLDKHSKKINAVNCVLVKKNIRGSNTDWSGYYKTLPKDKKLKHEHIESMKIAVEQADIRSIHPDKMEEFAEYLVRKARTQE